MLQLVKVNSLLAKFCIDFNLFCQNHTLLETTDGLKNSLTDIQYHCGEGQLCHRSYQQTLLDKWLITL